MLKVFSRVVALPLQTYLVLRILRETLHFPRRPYSVLKVVDFFQDKLVPKCRSCGITLQCENKKGPGYYIKQVGSAVPKNYKKEERGI